MTLKQWLRRARQPDYLGINARMMLKEYGGRYWRFRPLAPMLFHVAIGMSSADVKHTVMRQALRDMRK